MHSRPLTTVLASYNSRSRIVRDREGRIHLFWDTLSITMTQREFLTFVDLVKDAVRCASRCEELATSSCGRAVRCPMGQIMVTHLNLTLWFSPEEFEKFHKLTTAARRHLADVAPLPAVGRPWRPLHQEYVSPN